MKAAQSDHELTTVEVTAFSELGDAMETVRSLRSHRHNRSNCTTNHWLTERHGISHPPVSRRRCVTETCVAALKVKGGLVR